MKYLSIGIAVAAVAGAWAWWLHQRGHKAGVAAALPQTDHTAVQTGIDDAMVRTPSNPDPAMVRVPPNPDPKMVVDPSRRLREPGASGNGRKA